MNDTQTKIQSLEQSVQTLKEQVLKLERMLSIQGMPYELKEIIRNEVTKQEDLLFATTESVILPVLGNPSITVGKIQTGYLIIQWRGKDYRIPYYV